MANRRKFFKLYGEDKESKPPDYKPGTVSCPFRV